MVTSTSDERPSSDVTVNGNVERLVQIQQMQGDIHFMSDDLVAKLASAIDAQRRVDTGDQSVRRMVARSLSLLRSKGVLYASLDAETWMAVFPSLKELRTSLAAASAELSTGGPDSISSLIDLMVTALRDYLVRYEASFERHMYRNGRNNWDWHDQFSWPDLRYAAADMLTLRELLVGAIDPLNSYVRGGDAVEWDPKSYSRRWEIDDGDK